MIRAVIAIAGGACLGWGTGGCAGAPLASSSAEAVPSQTDASFAEHRSSGLPLLAPPVGKGWVRLTVDPLNAEIALDGVTQGLASEMQAPAAFELVPGIHRIEVRLIGFETYRAEVHVSADVTETIPVKLRRLPAMTEDQEKETAR